MGNAQLKEEIYLDDPLADELAPGSTLMHGQYTINAFLNAGGFGITYSARDSLDRCVVIKECFPGAFCRRSTALVTARSRAHQAELASIVRLFVQEARSLAKLDHPNIVGVHQVFEENNTAYMALDFVEGKDLLELIESGNHGLAPDDIEAMLRKLLDAISFVHDQGILHRDISPDNILLRKNGDPVLIDFGAAREQATKKSRVLSALRVVKDGYSPQEFYISGSEQGPYSDLYALGASFYHLVTGDLPPDAQARLAAVASGEADPYLRLEGRVPQFNKRFLRAIDKAMAILPKDRIESATHWLEMLDNDRSSRPVRIKSRKVDTAAAAVTGQPKRRKTLLMASAATLGFIGAGIYIAQPDIVPGLSPAAPAPEFTATAPVLAQDNAQTVVTEAQTPSLNADEAAPIAAQISPTDDAPAVAPTTPDAAIVTTAVPAQPAAQTTDVAVATNPVANISVEAPNALAEPAVAQIGAPSVPATYAAFAPVSVPVQPALLTVDAVAFADTVPFPIPVAFSPAPSGPPEPLERFGVIGMTSAWTVALPEGVNFSDDDVRLLAVNGQAVESRQDVDAVLYQTIGLPTTTAISLDLSMGTSAQNAEEATWTLPVMQRTVLPNGTAFEAMSENNTWITRVADVPVGATTDLQVGDILFGHLGTGDFLSGRTSLPEIVEAAARGETDMNFAVKRDGNTWMVSLPVFAAE